MMHLNDTTSPVKGQHLTLTERIKIQSWKCLDKSNQFIAKELGRSHSTINDAIKRGTAVQKKLVNGKPIYQEAYYAETGQFVSRSTVKRVNHDLSRLKSKDSSSMRNRKFKRRSGHRISSLEELLRKNFTTPMSEFALKHFIALSTKA